LEVASLDLFTDTWPLVASGNAPKTPQTKAGRTYHRRKDTDSIDHIDLDEQYTARHLIDVLRARTFAPYPGAYVEVDGKRVYLRLQLMYENDL
ncbi:MAG: hypothetical protein IIC84_08485, partial [Chloroflexi bacterium]|nr:hypothetical protein [Chloroflexota bacterium]